MEARASRCCALPDFDTNTWTATDVVLEHMGAEPDYEAEGTDSSWQHPPESIESEGCSGAWYRTAFVRSLLKYRRQLDSNNNRVDHHAYRECTDPFVQACLKLWEDEDAAAEGYRLKVVYG